MTDIVHIRHCFHQDDFLGIRNLADQVPINHPDYAEAQLLAVRSCMEQGVMAEAAVRMKRLSAGQLDTNSRVQLYCFQTFLQSLHGQTETGMEELQQGIKAWESDHGYSSPFLQAFMADFHQRCELVLIALGRRSKINWCVAMAGTPNIAQMYWAVGAWEEAWMTLMRGASASMKAPFADFSQARIWLQQVRQEATEQHQPLFVGQTYLTMGELGFAQSWATAPDTPADSDILQCFQEAADLLEQGGHRFAEATVLHRLGECMLRHGAPEGVQLLHQALEGLKVAEAYIQQQAAWRSLHIWHIRRGEPEQAIQAQAESEALNKRISLPMGVTVDALGMADMAFRKGEVAAALAILDTVMEADKPSALAVGAVSLMSTMLGQVGRAQEAIPRLQTVIRHLGAEGDTPLLAQIWFIFSTAYPVGSNECLTCLNQAIAVNRSLGDSQQEGYLLIQRAWQKLQQMRLQRPRQELTLTEPILADFEAARSLLLTHRHFEAMEMLVDLCQQWGQAYFITHEYEACGRWLTEAEQISEQMGLMQSLAFTKAQQGLVLMEVGRTVGPHAYDQAIPCFRRAASLFERAGVGGMIWRMIYYEGLAEYEAGQRETSEETRRHQRWHRARQRFSQAMENVDCLRGFAGSGASLKAQTAGAAFMVDKQTLYRTAFQLAYLSQHSEDMVQWLECMKNRALLDAMGELILPEEQLQAHPLIQAEAALRRQKAQTPVVAQALQCQRDIDQLLDKLEREPHTRAYVYLRKGRPVVWPAIQRWLQEQEQRLKDRRVLLVSYYYEPNLVLAIGMRSDWEAPQWERIAVDASIMAQTIQDYFRQPDGLRMALEDLGEAEWQMLRGVVLPISHWSQEGDIVGLIPSGMLHDLPLHTLQVGEQYLIERNPVFYLPSLSLLAYLRPAPPYVERMPLRAAVFGDSLGDLPGARAEGARAEAEAIAGLFSEVAVLGSTITKSRLLTALEEVDILHLAGHGELSAEDGWESGVLLPGHDKLRAQDLLGRLARARLAVLSGCETGISEHRAGDELFGMVRALILAGTSSVLVSQWRVQDASTRHLLTCFYQRLQKTKYRYKALALQQAILDTRKANGAWKSLYHWGGFVLIGSWQ